MPIHLVLEIGLWRKRSKRAQMTFFCNSLFLVKNIEFYVTTFPNSADLCLFDRSAICSFTVEKIHDIVWVSSFFPTPIGWITIHN